MTEEKRGRDEENRKGNREREKDREGEKGGGRKQGEKETSSSASFLIRTEDLTALPCDAKQQKASESLAEEMLAGENSQGFQLHHLLQPLLAITNTRTRLHVFCVAMFYHRRNCIRMSIFYVILQYHGTG